MTVAEFLENHHPEARSKLTGDKAQHGVFDNTKIKRLLPDWECRHTFRSAIRESVAWFREEESRRDVNNEVDSQIDRLIEADKLRKYSASEFLPKFRKDLAFDLDLLKQVSEQWMTVNRDPKLEYFVEALKRNKLLRGKRVIVFTESSETGAYLFENLDKQYPGKVLAYRSGGGRYQGESISQPEARRMIQANYDPTHHIQKNDLRILISTDVLAEGINLHRSNIVVNYDLPWNPTRVLQRVGRVNRVGTAFEQIYIFNFFPTSQSDEELGLEDNIKAKIQAFHDILGEDAKYLTDEEEVSQHELFGDRLYRTLNRKESYVGEEPEESELEFLQVIRKVRDETPALFEKIKRLPKKARAGRRLGWGDELGLPEEVLVSFFRRGRLKKFYLAGKDASEELVFLDAVNWLRCEPETARISIPQAYYAMLEQNKQAFAEATTIGNDDFRAGGSKSNVGWIIKYIKAIWKAPQLTDDQEQYFRKVLAAFEMGVVPSNTSKRLRQLLEKEGNPLKAVGLMRANISEAILQPGRKDDLQNKPIEVILSAYLEREMLPEGDNDGS